MNNYPYLMNNFQNPFQSQIQNQQNQNNSLIWVQGEAAAKSYLVAPNCTVTLWDSEKPVIYLKSADNTGMPSMKIIDYVVRDNRQKPEGIVANSSFATKDDIETIQSQINELNSQIELLSSKKTTSSKKEVVKDA